MKTFDLKPLIEKFNSYISNAGNDDAAGARKEFDELIKKVFSPFDYAKSSKQQLEQRIQQHNSFIMICDALGASENENTYMIQALALAGRGSTYQALNDNENGARDFRRSADVAAGYPGGEQVRISSVLRLAAVYGKMQKTNESIACFSEALKLASRLDGDEGRIRKMAILADRGSAYCRLRKLDEACADFNGAVELYNSLPSNENTRRILLKCLANRSGVLVSMQRYQDARDDGMKAVEIEGENISSITPVVLTNLAAACKCLGYLDEAEKHYTRVIMIKRVSGVIKTPFGRIDLATMLMGRGEVYLKNDKLDEAKADLSQAIELFNDVMEKHSNVVKPRLLGALKLRYQVYERLGDNHAAEKDLSMTENLTGKALD